VLIDSGDLDALLSLGLPVDTGAPAGIERDGLPVGDYALADGRRFVGMDDFQLRAAAREAWRRQQIADAHLARRLAASPRPVPVRSATPARFTTGDLFAQQTYAQAEGGGSSRADAREGVARTPRVR
jgi:hypothetical protein